MFILDDIILLPVKGVVWLADRIKEQAEGSLYNTTALKEALQELQSRFDAGAISQKEYDQLEVKYLKAIEDAKKYHEQRRAAGLEE